MFVDVEIKGIYAMLIHRFTDQAEADLGTATRTVVRKNEPPRDQAERGVYRDKAGNCTFPGAAISRALKDAGAAHKVKGSRKSVRFLVPAAVLVPEEHINLLHPASFKPLDNFEVDSRSVVIPATKGRVMRHRARFDEWCARFTLEIDTEVLPADLIHQLLQEAGKRQGIGDFRPEKGGPFGRFMVTKWAERQEKKVA